MILKVKIVYVIGVMLMASSLLMILANNIPVLLSVRWFWGPLLILFVILGEPKVFLHQSSVYTLLYGFFFCFVLQRDLWFFANDWYKSEIFNDFYSLTTAVLFFVVLRKKKYYNIWSRIASLAILFMFITSVVTIIVTVFNPVAVRELYGESHNLVYKSALFSYGIATYGFMTAIIALFPTLVYFYKNTNRLLHRYSLIGLMLLFFLLIVRAQIFANILVAILTILFSFLGAKNIKVTSLLVSFILLVAFIIPTEVYSSFMITISSYFNSNSEIYHKLLDTSEFIVTPQMMRYSSGIDSRVERYPALFEAFLSNPLFGDAYQDTTFDRAMDLGGHLYWMSRLALWGILGFVGYLLILKKIINNVFVIFDTEFKYYYFLSVFSVFAMGFMKHLQGREIWLMLIVIIPGLYFKGKHYPHSGIFTTRYN